ncbi:MAG TPA: HAD family phosphatase [Chthoniobacteraceae bacterium]|jgi:HAD superfamily hydrolase (TIGR01509 family)
MSDFSPTIELPPGDFSAFIFDCDGTLADTMPTHYQAWTTALGRYSEKFPEALFYEMGGAPTARIVELLNERHGLALDVEETVQRKEAIFLELSPHVAAIEPVVALAREFSRQQKPMAVASGGHRRIVMNTLRAIGIADLFRVIVTSEDYQRGKPAPDPFLEAALRLSVDPGECLVFEDTATGVAAAKAAGMCWVLVPPPGRKRAVA